MTESTPPPRHLTKLTKGVWRDVLKTWDLDPTGLLLLRAGLEQYDTYQRARAELAKADALTVTSDTGVVRQHPAAKISLDALGESRQCFGQLALELPDPDAPWKDRALGRRPRTD